MTTAPLDPLDRAILDLLQEEGAEVLLEYVTVIGRLIKVASKVQRFGNGLNPFEKEPRPNFELLQDEVGDFEALVDILIERGILTRAGIDARKVWKRGMLRTHKTLPPEAFSVENLPPVTAPSAFDQFPPDNPIVKAAKAARNAPYAALFGGHAPSAEPPIDETWRDTGPAQMTRRDPVRDVIQVADVSPPALQFAPPGADGEALYRRYTNVAAFHSNRMPAWHELSPDTQRLWTEAALSGKAAP